MKKLIKPIKPLVKSLTRREAEIERATSEYGSWLTDMTKRLENTHGPYFIGGFRRPFPFNKEYTCPSVLSSEKKVNIITDLSKGLSHNILSQKHNVSVSRVRAVEKLHALRTSLLNNGGALHTEYATKIQGMIFRGVERRVSTESPNSQLKAKTPRLRYIPEASRVDLGHKAPQTPTEETSKDIACSYAKSWFFLDTSSKDLEITMFRNGTHTKDIDLPTKRHVWRSQGYNLDTRP